MPNDLRQRGIDTALAALLLALLLLVSPLQRLWAGAPAPWWLLFALWGR